MRVLQPLSNCHPLLGGWLAAVLLMGCSQNPVAEFRYRESTSNLLTDARLRMEKGLADHFGTPNELVAWDRLPVNYGGIRGEITTIGEAKGPEVLSVNVALKEPDALLPAKGHLTWLSGAGLKDQPNGVDVIVSNSKELTFHFTTPVAAAAGDQFAIDFGSQLQLGRMSYMKNCMHCHGVTGDGDGPTARYLNPLPRDFRLGVLKYTETHASERASRQDLWRIIKDGIPGTYMPSFLLLKDEETHAIIEYVRWLAMRGEIEKRMGDELIDYSRLSIQDEFVKAKNSYDAAIAGGEKPDEIPSIDKLEATANEDLKEYLAEDFNDTWSDTADFVAESWSRADEDESVIVPSVARVADTPASRANGRLLYLSDKTKCYTCHGNTGRGNGSAAEDYWPKPGSTEKYENRGLHDVWGHVVPPRNLRMNQYRGGRRPVDVYRRIYAGIKGTPMPAFGGTVLKDEEIWDVVNFVMALPYETDEGINAQNVVAHPAEPSATAAVNAR